MTATAPMPAADSNFDSTIRAVDGRSRTPSTPNDLLRVSRLELRRLVRRMTDGRHDPAVIDPTTLVNEVARRLLGASGTQDLPSRSDFFADLAGAFRKLLMPGAMGRIPSGARLSLSHLDFEGRPTAGDVERCLRELEYRTPKHAQIAILRVFGGMTCGEIAEQMHQPESRVTAGWAAAKKWIEKRLATSARSR